MRVYRTPNNDEKKKMRSSGREKLLRQNSIRFSFDGEREREEMNELK